MKCQIQFSGKNKKKYFKMSSAEIFTQHATKRYIHRWVLNILSQTGIHRH